jgi:hypothetical protein
VKPSQKNPDKQRYGNHTAEPIHSVTHLFQRVRLAGFQLAIDRKQTIGNPDQVDESPIIHR